MLEQHEQNFRFNIPSEQLTLAHVFARIEAARAGSDQAGAHAQLEIQEYLLYEQVPFFCRSACSILLRRLTRSSETKILQSFDRECWFAGTRFDTTGSLGQVRSIADDVGAGLQRLRRSARGRAGADPRHGAASTGC